MFKKTKLAAATVALLGAAAAQNVSAVAIDDSGTSAQVLLFPYYNVNNNFISMFNIRNTKGEYKAVKIRFRESRVSNDALDFNIYMSPWDHYSFYLYADGENVRIHTDDNTCSFPEKALVNQQTFTQAYVNTGPSDLKEGYVEIIEMGLVAEGTPAGSTKTIHEGLKHNDQGIPGDCSVVTKAWTKTPFFFTEGGALNKALQPVMGANGDYAMTSANVADFYGAAVPLHMTAPTGGLAGYSALLDSASGLIYAEEATPIRNWQTGVAQHYRSDNNNWYLLPALASGNVVSVAKQNATGTGATFDIWQGVKYDFSLVDPNLAYINGDNPPRPAGINPFPIADALAAMGLHNDFLMTETADWYGKTDWVVTFPMRKHGIFNNYRYDGLTTTDRDANKKDPSKSVKYFFRTGTDDTEFSYVAYDREEYEPIPGVGFSPVITTTSHSFLKREANVIQWDYNGSAHQGGSVLGTPAAAAVPLTLSGNYTEGWAMISYVGDTTLSALAANTWGAGTVKWAADFNPALPFVRGVPSIGFAAMKGVAGNRGIGETVSHVFVR